MSSRSATRRSNVGESVTVYLILLHLLIMIVPLPNHCMLKITPQTNYWGNSSLLLTPHYYSVLTLDEEESYVILCSKAVWSSLTNVEANINFLSNRLGIQVCYIILLKYSSVNFFKFDVKHFGRWEMGNGKWGCGQGKNVSCEKGEGFCQFAQQLDSRKSSI